MGKWAKSQKKKQKNQMNKQKQNGNSSKKRKLEATKEGQTTNGCIEAPPAKKQKVDENVDASSTIKKESKKKVLKRILKRKQKATSLRAVFDEFNKEIEIENKEDNSIFLQTLWKISDKVSINTMVSNV